MKMSVRATIAVGSALASACVWSLPAAAQSEAPQAAAVDDQSANDSSSGEIIVTAQRREERLQDLPIAATVVSGEALDEKAVQNVSDLQFAAPGLSIINTGVLISVNIRGIGISSGSLQAQNGVATYYDGLFQPPIVQTGAFYDIDNIAVFRGPQGTLVGSNSTGGAIFITTKRPDFERVGGYAQIEYGNYGNISGEGAANVPLTDNLAVRVAGLAHHRNSYYTDVGRFQNKAGKVDEVAGRATVRWKPGNLEFVARGELIDRQTGGFASRPVPTTTYSAGRVGDIRTLSFDTPTSGRERAFISSLETRYETDGGLVVRYLGGYQNKQVDLLNDVDSAALASPPPSVIGVQHLRERQDSHEINIISPTTGAFSWIVGGYYQRNRIDVDIVNTSDGFPVDITPQNDKKTRGVFMQANYKISSQFEIQAGARYTWFDSNTVGAVRIGRGIPGFPGNGLQVVDFAGSYSDNQWTGKVALNYTPNDDNLFYVFVAKGYKPGGFNATKFAPEVVWDYEAGWKGSFAGRKIQTQLGIFYNQYKNFQLDLLSANTGAPTVQNLPRATIKGAEFQVQARLGGFQFDGGVTYVDSKLGSIAFINSRLLPGSNLGPQCAPGAPSNPPVCYNYGPFTQQSAEGPNLNSPKWSGNLGAQYAFRLSGDASLTPRLNYAYVGPQFINSLLYNPATDRLRGRGLLSALITYRDGPLKLEGYANNITNENYVVGQTTDNSEFYGAPREYGARLGYTF